MKKILVLILATLMLLSFAGCGWGSPEVDSRKTAIKYAETTLKSKLKNPDALQIHDTSVMSSFEYGDYFYYNIKLDYSAQNGFGGYNRDTYDVNVKVSKTNEKASEVSNTEYVDIWKKSQNN